MVKAILRNSRHCSWLLHSCFSKFVLSDTLEELLLHHWILHRYRRNRLGDGCVHWHLLLHQLVKAVGMALTLIDCVSVRLIISQTLFIHADIFFD